MPHMPSLPGRLQALHRPVQSVAQHTSSTHRPETQLVLSAHGIPLASNGLSARASSFTTSEAASLPPVNGGAERFTHPAANSRSASERLHIVISKVTRECLETALRPGLGSIA